MSISLSVSSASGKRIHFVGIKGVGMTALAELYIARGATVSGSDTDESFFTDDVLARIGILPEVGFSREHISDDIDFVVYSTAYDPETNPELVEARERDIPIRSYSQAVGELTHEQMSLLVAGSHGKTTISAMLAEALRRADVDPSAIVGSHVRSWQGNALSGQGSYLVLEADEYQNKLDLYEPFSVILSSIDWDHPDCFPDEESYMEVFRRFVTRIPRHGTLVYCADSASVSQVADSASCTRLSYGFHKDADVRIRHYEGQDAEGGVFRSRFSVSYGDHDLGSFSTPLPGRHNAANAAAVIALCSSLRIDIERVREALAEFSGTARRSEYVGSYRGIPVYDDYAHHPEELRATLAAFHESYPNRRIVAVFHPHTYTRTKALLADFAQSFDDAGRVIVLDIYGSAREKQGGVSSADLVREINRFTPGKAEHIPTIPETIEVLTATLDTNDLLLTFGAGDVWRVAKGVVEAETPS